ncbi:MAG: hypothetical protein VX519_03870 [Myxococcota bacterium]|nr:hypothetical protein [Myxococcota bacterium]
MSRFEIFAVAAPGLEDIVGQEVANLCGREVTGVPGGVMITGELIDAAGLVLYSRTASRILVRLGTVPAGSVQELEQRSRKLPWASYLWPGQDIKIRATIKNAKIRRRDMVEKKMLSCARHGATKQRPKDPSLKRETQEVVVRVIGREATISMDASGLLHRRGYRKATAKAPLRENLAAALLHTALWSPEEPLVDPMCGSGTFAIEAALMAMDQPPGLHLTPPLSRWPITPRDFWSGLTTSHEPMAPTRPQIWGADRDPGAIRAARENAKRAGVSSQIRWDNCELGSFTAPTEQTGLVIMNPPYGKRIGDPSKVQSLYKSLGRKLQAGFPGWRLAVVCPNRALASRLVPGIREETSFENGGLKVSFFTGTIPGGSDDSL